MVCCLGIIRAKDTVGKEMTTMMMMKMMRMMRMMMRRRRRRRMIMVIVMILQVSPVVYSTQQKSIPGTKGGIAFWLIRIK